MLLIRMDGFGIFKKLVAITTKTEPQTKVRLRLYLHLFRYLILDNAIILIAFQLHIGQAAFKE